MTYAADLTPEQAWDLLASDPSAVLVDVRTDAEWRYVGVPDTAATGSTAVFIEWNTYPAGARNPDFLRHLAEAGIIAGQPIVFLCRSGVRSVDAAIAATEAGYGPCYNVLDGFEGPLDEAGHRSIRGWKAAGLAWRQ